MPLNKNRDTRANESFNQDKEPTLEELLAQSKPGAFELTDDDKEWLDAAPEGHESQ